MCGFRYIYFHILIALRVWMWKNQL